MPGARASTPPRPWPGTEPAAPPASARLPQGQPAGCLNPKHSSEGDSSKGWGRRRTGGPGWQTGQTHGHSDSSPAIRACPWVRDGQDQVRFLRASQLHPPPLHQGSPERRGPSRRLPGSAHFLPRAPSFLPRPPPRPSGMENRISFLLPIRTTGSVLAAPPTWNSRIQAD